MLFLLTVKTPKRMNVILIEKDGVVATSFLDSLALRIGLVPYLSLAHCWRVLSVTITCSLESISCLVGFPKDTFFRPLGVLMQPLPARSLNSSANPNGVRMS